MELKNYLKERKQLVEDKLKEIISKAKEDNPGKLTQAMEYSVMNGGKRLRPILVLAAYELFKNDIKKALEPACGIELVHCASLVLDDLPCMDNADIRRGKPATHKVYGESTAILASAALFALTFDIFSKIPSIKINEFVHETAKTMGSNGMTKGQMMDLESFSKESSIEELRKVYYSKTGILFCNSVKIGAMLGKAKKTELKALEDYAKALGLAFQIRDDILDVVSSEKEIGKGIKTDERNKKLSYPLVIGVEKSKVVLKEEIGNAKAVLKIFGSKAEALVLIADFIGESVLT